MLAVPGPAMEIGPGPGSLGSGSTSLLPKDENGVELNQGRVTSIYKVTTWSEGYLFSKGVLVVWEDAEQQ